jgi:hypothetical protein
MDGMFVRNLKQWGKIKVPAVWDVLLASSGKGMAKPMRWKFKMYLWNRICV